MQNWQPISLTNRFLPRSAGRMCRVPGTALLAPMLLTTVMLAATLASTSATAQAQGADPVPAPEKTIPELARELEMLRSQVGQLTGNLSEALTQIKQNREAIDSLTDQINEQLIRQQQILDAISTTDSNGTRIPRLSAKMEESPEFQQDVSNAVHKSLKKTGTFKITNRMATTQRIAVNRKDFDVSPGEELTLEVPVGTVTTQLPGQPIENWTIAAPDYLESISIVPQTAQETAVQFQTYYSPGYYSYYPW